MSTQFVEALKEFLRTALLAIVAIVLAQLQAGQPIDLHAVVLAAAVALLRAIDKYLHEAGVQSPLDLKPLDAFKS